MAQLHVLKGDTPGRTIDLLGGELIIGRDADCDIAYPRKGAISRQHARLMRDGEDFFIEDLKSRNGTYVNNQEVADIRVRLREGDRIRICDVLYVFRSRPGVDPGQSLDLADGEPLAVVRELPADPAAWRPLVETLPATRRLLLAELADALTETLQIDPLLARTADSLLQLFPEADRCFVLLRGPDSQLETRAGRGRAGDASGPLRVSAALVRRCLDEAQGFLAAGGGGSVLTAPLALPGGKGPFGLLVLDGTVPFVDDPLPALLHFARRAAVALDNAQTHYNALHDAREQKERKLAEQVQCSFLPAGKPVLPGYEFFAFYQAALTVGGDYYDFLPLPGGRYAVLVGDVSGKGVPAALLMARLSAEARFCVPSAPDLATGLSRLNSQLHPVLTAGGRCRFVTLAGVVLDPLTGTVTVANAGHLLPLIYRGLTGEVEEAITDREGGRPLGITDGYQYRQITTRLDAGDSLLLFTDGLTDATNPAGDPFGVPGIRQAVRVLGEEVPEQPSRPVDLGNRIIRAVKQHSAGHDQDDDITLICFGRTMSAEPDGLAGDLTRPF
jgi:serine phosphatase RsbU (regulator of sigma subunit)/pSer/pThr/pTyr-binding forkhead associated (FHA) protein